VTLYCATGNPGKLREFALIARAAGIVLEPLSCYGDLAPCDETGSTFEENAILKARHYGPHAPGLLFADDSGLEVGALGGAPGVRSARYAGERATDEDNNRLLLERMRGRADRAARFVCVLALAQGERILGTFRGTVEGTLLEEPRGAGGFGYDPLFLYPPFGKSFGEIAPAQKMTVSHRGRAMRALVSRLAPTAGGEVLE
jgi:XTP/dITP diphosphohydrolase